MLLRYEETLSEKKTKRESQNVSPCLCISSRNVILSSTPGTPIWSFPALLKTKVLGALSMNYSYPTLLYIYIHYIIYYIYVYIMYL